jgi:hypothetical protein
MRCGRGRTIDSCLGQMFDFGVWSTERYCFPDGNEATTELPPESTPMDRVPQFQDVLRKFEPPTGTASGYLALSAPASVEELDNRVTEFILTAYRENNYLVQGIERLDMAVDT